MTLSEKYKLPADVVSIIRREKRIKLKYNVPAKLQYLLEEQLGSDEFLTSYDDADKEREDIPLWWERGIPLNLSKREQKREVQRQALINKQLDIQKDQLERIKKEYISKINEQEKIFLEKIKKRNSLVELKKQELINQKKKQDEEYQKALYEFELEIQKERQEKQEKKKRLKDLAETEELIEKLNAGQEEYKKRLVILGRELEAIKNENEQLEAELVKTRKEKGISHEFKLFSKTGLAYAVPQGEIIEESEPVMVAHVEIIPEEEIEESKDDSIKEEVITEIEEDKTVKDSKEETKAEEIKAEELPVVPKREKVLYVEDNRWHIDPDYVPYKKDYSYINQDYIYEVKNLRIYDYRNNYEQISGVNFFVKKSKSSVVFCRSDEQLRLLTASLDNELKEDFYRAAGRITFLSEDVSDLNPYELLDKFRNDYSSLALNLKAVGHSSKKTVARVLEGKKFNKHILKDVMLRLGLDLKKVILKKALKLTDGERQILALALTLAKEKLFISLYEPTNNLENWQKQVLINLINEKIYKGSMLIVSSDESFVVNLKDINTFGI